PSPCTRMVTERETEFCPPSFVCSAAFGYDERLSSIESAIFAIPKSPGKHGGKSMAISVGTAAPDFTLKDQSQKEVKLSDFTGKKKVVLVFYPLDWSPTCTNEHACFVNDMRNFETLDAEVLGVSVDSVWSHKAYAEKMGIKYSLLADFHPKGAMSEKYGVYMADKGITGRSIIIVDKGGKVAWVKDYDIPVVPDVKEVATALGSVK